MAETQIVAGREQNKFYPYSDLFYVNRHSFWDAGQDSYTLPPAQSQDMFQQLINVEPVTQGVLQRRRGYTLFSNQTPLLPYTRSYSYRNEGFGLRYLVWSNLAGVSITDEAGNNVITNNAPFPVLFNASSNATFVPRMVLSRDYAYFADGAPTDYKKWNGATTSLNLTNWGIDVNDSTGGGGNATNAPTLAANDSAGTVNWANPNAALVLDNVDATSTITANQHSNNLKLTGYGFSIPASAVITKIQANVRGYVSSSGGYFPTMTTSLLRAGVATGTGNGLYATIPHNSNGDFTFVWTPNMWGYNWTPADVNGSGFGISFNTASFAITDTETSAVDYASLTVVYSLSSGGGGSITVGPPAAGKITLLSGRTYFYAFQNSKTGHVSDIGPPSLTTGPLTNNSVPLSTIPVSNDPQVDTVLLLATADGNDQTTLFLLATLPNGTTTYTDNTPDSLTAANPTGAALLSNAVFQDTDQLGVLHGLANNKLPPTANFPVKHKGRIYMALGHNLYFSKNLDEVTTSTGTITSKWEEAWPATNVIDISEQAETVKALMSDGETLWIATERNIRRLIGDSPQNFQKPEVQFNECGVISPEVWKVVFYEGQPVGTMWLTPDLRVMASDFNTYQDIGTPIQDVLNSVTQSAISTAHASFVSQAAFDLFMLYLPVNSSPAPNIVAIFNMRSKKWCIWRPTDTISTSLFNINAAGLPQWLFAASAGSLFFWDSTVNTDRTGVAPSGTVQTLTITNGGSGYTSFPIFVNFSGGGGSGANAVVTGLSLGVITQVTLTSGGIGYTSAPTFTFSGGGTGGGGTSTIAVVPNTTTYAVTIQTSWLDFGDYNIRKFVNQIIPTTADNNGLTIQVDAASNEQDFNSPLSVVGPTVVIPAAIPNDVFVPLASGPSHSRAFRFTFNSPNGTIQNVLTGYAIEAGVFHRY